MNSGIYALYWPKQDLIYIGQTNNFSVRKYEHFRLFKTGTASNYKLKNAYDLYGEPDFEVICICPTSDLDSNEYLYIKEFDSVKNGLNILDKPFGTGKDTEHQAAKFSKEEILNVVELLLQGHTLDYITKITKVSKPVISSILNQHRHTWIPENKKELLAIELSKRQLKVSRDSSGLNYWIKSPEGVVHQVPNISQFSRDNKLLNTKLNEVLRNKRKSHCGWTRPTEKEILECQQLTKSQQ